MEPAPDSKSLADLLREGQRRLAGAGIETARLDAEVLLRYVLGLDRTGLFLRLREPPPEDARSAFDVLVARRVAGEPVAYLTGEREFMGLAFAVGPGVLVPRPETELLVEWAVGWLADRPEARVIDVGTGSGAIALAVAVHAAPHFGGLIVGSDVSAVALGFATRNRARCGLTERVALVRGNLLDWCRGPVDLVLANLPYLRPEQAAGNRELAAEPSLALVGGAEGLDLIRRLLAGAPRVLAPHGAIALELDPSQAEAAAALAGATFPRAHVRIMPDLAGLARFVAVSR